MITARRVRLCLKDLYHQDVIEMIERETRKYKLWVIEDPSDPHFEGAYNLLWEKFGPSGEMERREAIEAFLREDSFEPMATGTFIRYFLIVATDKDGVVRGVRDGSILVNPSYAPDLCVVYLSHIYMLEEARGTVLSYWLRISPMEIAVQYLADLHAKNLIELPHPKNPGRTFGMRITLAAEMEYWAPEDPISLQRILFYGRGGFDVLNPAHFPYRQPDFRDPAVIRATGNQPLPFMLLLRRMGREREASLPISEAEAIMRLIYDDFAAFCAPEHLENSLDIVLSRLERQRDRGKTQVELLPLPTGPRDLARLKPIFRYKVFKQHYKSAPETLHYLQSGVSEKVAADRRYIDKQLAAIAEALSRRPHYVYGSREKYFNWDGSLLESPEEQQPVDVHESDTESLQRA